MKNNNINVVCRFRPCNKKEQKLALINKQECSQTHITVIKNEDKKKLPFNFNRIFYEDSTQIEMFEYSAKPIVQSVIEGFNGTILAYGQTASGKTYSMLGSNTEMGIIPRMISCLFDHIEEQNENIEFGLRASMLEIYCEKIRDLIDTSNIDLKIRENKIKGLYIQDLFECPIRDEEEISVLLSKGFDNRSTATTNMNEGSSRSHLLLLLEVKQKDINDLSLKTSKMYMIDLAGSESVGKTGADGVQFEEAKKINLSLVSLKSVINSISKNASFIPYRDSKLTRIIQDSLGGNSKTTLVICCSPSAYNEQETISTLRFGMTASSIKNIPKINIEMTVEQLSHLLAIAEQKIVHLTGEVEYYQKILKDHNITYAKYKYNEKEEGVGPEKEEQEDSQLHQKLKIQKSIDDQKINQYQQQINSFQDEISRKNENLKVFNKKFLTVKTKAGSMYNEIGLLNKQNQELIEKMAVMSLKVQRQEEELKGDKRDKQAQQQSQEAHQQTQAEQQKSIDKLRQEKFGLSALVEELTRNIKMGDQSRKQIIELGKQVVADQEGKQGKAYREEIQELQSKYQSLKEAYEKLGKKQFGDQSAFRQDMVAQLVTQFQDQQQSGQSELLKQFQLQREHTLGELQTRLAQLETLEKDFKANDKTVLELKGQLVQKEKDENSLLSEVETLRRLNQQMVISQQLVEDKFQAKVAEQNALEDRVVQVSQKMQAQALRMEGLEERNFQGFDMEGSGMINMASTQHTPQKINFRNSGLLMVDSNHRKQPYRNVLSNKVNSIFGNNTMNHGSTMHNMMSINRRNDQHSAILEEDQMFDASQTYSSQHFQQKTAPRQKY